MSQSLSKKAKKAVVVHSGGMDSSLCLALAIQEFGKEQVLSLSYRYHQRHSQELEQAAFICKSWGVDHIVIDLPSFQQITHNALVDHDIDIDYQKGQTPNTLVEGRNGVMALLAAVHAHSLGANCIYLGVMELEEANSGYRDCSRMYMDLIQQLARIDLNEPAFEVRTPLVFLTKLQGLELAESLGIREFLIEHTISCYEGLRGNGCKTCPACILRNTAISQFINAQMT